jgi:hypothetical protein
LQGTAVSETKEFRKDFITEVVDRSGCNMIATEVVCYRGDSPDPRWTDSEPGTWGYQRASPLILRGGRDVLNLV